MPEVSEPRRCPWRQLEGWENRSLLARRGLVCRRRRRELTQRCAPVPYASPAPPSCQSTPSPCVVYPGPAPSVHAAIAGPDMQRRGVAFGGAGSDSDEDDARATLHRRPCFSHVPRRHPRSRVLRRQGPGRRRRRQQLRRKR